MAKKNNLKMRNNFYDIPRFGYNFVYYVLSLI